MICVKCGKKMGGGYADGGTILRGVVNGRLKTVFAQLCKKCLDEEFPARDNAEVVQDGAERTGAERTGAERTGAERKGKAKEWLSGMKKKLAGS